MCGGGLVSFAKVHSAGLAFLFGLVFAAAGLAWEPQEWRTWLIAVLAYGIAGITAHQFRLRPAETWILVLVILAHHVASLYHVHVWPLPSSETDANTFHTLAFNRLSRGEGMDFTIGTGAYVSILFAVYSVAGKSLLTGQYFSALIGSAAIAGFTALIARLEIDRRLWVWCLLLFAWTPSFLLHTTLTVREGVQLALLIAGTLACLTAIRTPSLPALTIAWMFWLATGLLHQVMLFYAAVLMAGSGTVYWFSLRHRSSLRLAVVLAAAIVVAVTALVSVPAKYEDSYLDDLHHGFTEAVVDYRDSIDKANPRTGYGFRVPLDSYEEFFLGLARSYVHYQFGPLWRWPTEPADWILVGEALMRTLGTAWLLYAIAVCRSRRGVLAVLMLGYFGMTLLWSMGTTNYGQAFRHHLLSNWMLIVAGAVAWTNLYGVCVHARITARN